MRQPSSISRAHQRSSQWFVEDRRPSMGHVADHLGPPLAQSAEDLSGAGK
jgi:hypothetical protein